MKRRRAASAPPPASPLGWLSPHVRPWLSVSGLRALWLQPGLPGSVGAAILLLDLLLSVLVVQRVPYTEIDWRAYMQECAGFLNGSTDYAVLRGDTGPLVYPAGFLYVYSLLSWVTGGGQDVRLAQHVFTLLYVVQLWLWLRLYARTAKVPPYALALSVLTSYRIHSVYLLRLFNDPVCVLLSVAALNLFLAQRWTAGSLLYSAAVSVKMNALLYAPALLLMYVVCLGWRGAVKQLAVCAGLQLLLGAPFLLTHPVAYLRGAFDVGRVFDHQWTVNYRFLPVHIFENRKFHLGLLGLHLLLLGLFFPVARRYLRSFRELKEAQEVLQPQLEAERERKDKLERVVRRRPRPQAEEALTRDQRHFLESYESQLAQAGGKREDPLSLSFQSADRLALLPLLLANFIGVACARSLHYQFYSWYFHSLPYLVWSASLPTVLRLLLLAVLELCWNTYPSSELSSAALHVVHAVLLWRIYCAASHSLPAQHIRSKQP